MFTHRQILIYIHRSAAHMRGNKRSRADASGGEKRANSCKYAAADSEQSCGGRMQLGGACGRPREPKNQAILIELADWK